MQINCQLYKNHTKTHENRHMKIDSFRLLVQSDRFDACNNFVAVIIVQFTHSLILTIEETAENTNVEFWQFSRL